MTRNLRARNVFASGSFAPKNLGASLKTAAATFASSRITSGDLFFARSRFRRDSSKTVGANVAGAFESSYVGEVNSLTILAPRTFGSRTNLATEHVGVFTAI